MESKSDLLQALSQTRERIEALVTSLSEDALDVPYHPGVNPPVWELGHSMFFYEIFVLQYLDGTPTWDPSMDELWDSFHMAHRDRWSTSLFPSRADTLAYADVIYKRLAERLQRKPLTDQALYLYRYAIYHQNMHIESMIWCRQTSAYPAPDSLEEVTPEPDTPVPGDAHIPAGRYWLGVPSPSEDYAKGAFAFDNEKPGFAVDMPAFSIARQLVSNGEFLAFVEAGGYEKPELWSQGGRKWLLDAGEPGHPGYWRHTDDGWQERQFDRWLPLVPDHPVKQISYWEAEAWCAWAGRRLPTEYEWEVAALGNREGGERRQFPWGNALKRRAIDMDGRHMGRLPVSAFPGGDSPFGCRQMIGTVWEWTSSQFLPYDGFCIDMYPFMSTLQFGDHKTTRGGSCATSSLLIRGTYRQAYAPDRSDVFTGFRTCACD